MKLCRTLINMVFVLYVIALALFLIAAFDLLDSRAMQCRRYF
ncbi:hypothetical protein [Paracoccus benzoatiresistens]|uniref:Uncharacterized protein n=1 Tax=Paracoccus benzoatiresistens TaxID=2997341 RepID=A0ABT4J7M8_9RHOB|nr:hypothetical protein [Paracoccus sp. EF6]MCZ0963120.1 hypothetical protein [Paracoccus sp. EF6]